MTISYSISLDIMKRIVGALSPTNNEISFHYTEDGMTVMATDIANVSLARIIVPKELLKGYDNIYNRKFALSSEALEKMFKSCDDTLNVIIHDEGSMAGIIEVTSGKFSWRSDMIVTETDMNRFPPLMPTARSEYSVKEFNLFLGNAGKKDVEVQFLINGHDAKICLGDERKGCSQTFTQSEEIEEVESWYNLEYVVALGKAATKSINDKLVILMNSKYPLRAEFEICEGVSAVIYIAPWMHEE